MSNDWTDERLARAALGSLLRFGAPAVLRLAAAVGPIEAWQRLSAGQAGEAAPPCGRGAGAADPMQARPGGAAPAPWAASITPQRVAAETERAGLRFVIPGDDEWPERLDDLVRCFVNGMGGAPVGLWVGGPGHLARWSVEAVALVGARAATRYGESVAMRLASDLAGAVGETRRTIVSGGAFGIDAAGHRGALLVDGRTIGVFANGLDRPYPPGNAVLFKSLMAQGLVISEMPPGAVPTRHGFLERNRLIAALSRGTVVVEAALRSGARNTASWAAELGRVLMAVPGPVTSAMSQTPHRLIRDGEAVLVADAADVEALLSPVGQGDALPTLGPTRPEDALMGDAVVVREALPARGAVTLGEVALASGVPVQRCAEALHGLAAKGLAVLDEHGRWRLRRPNRDREEVAP